jgi:hypothetical protein
MSRALVLPCAVVLACLPLGCHPRMPNPAPPDVAPIEDAPTLRTTPTPPGRNGDVPGPPVVKP